MDNSRARRIAHLSQCEGFQDLMSDLTERIAEAKEELFQIMSSKPDILTGKTALRLAARAKALEEFRENILDEIKLAQK